MAKRKNVGSSSASTAPIKRPAAATVETEVTAASLQTHGEVHRHIENFQKGRITCEELQDILGNKQMQKVWKNFEYHRNQNPQAKDQWNQVCELKRGDQKDSK